MRQELNVAISKSKWNKVTSVCVKTKWPLYTVSWNKLHGIIAVGGGDSEIRFTICNKFDFMHVESSFLFLLMRCGKENSYFQAGMLHCFDFLLSVFLICHAIVPSEHHIVSSEISNCIQEYRCVNFNLI